MTPRSDSFENLLNVGCGRCYHNDWTNIDLVASGPEVRQYDLRKGLPYEDRSFDAVYHSHVLEHLSPDDAGEMLAECRRVLRPGGVLRVVVPDLEGIAKAYLRSVDAAETGDPYGEANHRWMTLELIDQLTRERGGGRMGVAMRNPELINHDFIRARIGGEIGAHPRDGAKKTLAQRISRIISDVRRSFAMAAVTLVDGRSGAAAYREGRFRQSGEIHRWMYDRVSLAALMIEVGFEQPRVYQSHSSRIAEFDSFQLDRMGNVARKPDSLYMESLRPGATASQLHVPSSRAA